MTDYILFEVSPGIRAVILPDAPHFTVVAVSDDFIAATGIPREQLKGRGLFEHFLGSPNDTDSDEENIRASFQYVIQHKKPHWVSKYRYDIPDYEGTLTKKYWKAHNVPVLSDTGEVQYIIHTVQDITAEVLSEQKEMHIKGLEKAYNLFMNAPVIIGIVKGDTYVIEFANDGLLEVWGRTDEVIGKPLVQAIPEIKEQGYIELLDEVRRTGKPYHANEAPIILVRNGKEELLFFDFVYKPFYDDKTQNIASGVIAIGYDVTEKVLARRKVQESEEKYRNLFESMDQGFCIVELVYDEHGQPVDYRLLETNPMFEKQTGLKDAEGKTARVLVPNIELHWNELYHQVASTGKPMRSLEESKALNRWFDVYVYKVDEPESRKVAVLFTDITERKKIETETFQAKERFELVAKATQDAIWDWNLITNEIWWNEGFKELFGYNEEEIEPTVDSWYNRLHAEDKERVVGNIHQVIENGGKQWSDEYRFRKKDGTYAIVFDRGYALHNEEGKPYRMLGSMQDITKRKQFEKTLEESERRFRTLAQNSPDLITRHGKDFKYLYVSPLIEQLTGIKPEAFIGRSYWELDIPRYLCSFFDEHLAIAFRTGALHHTEYSVYADREVHIYSRLVPEFDEKGEMVSVLVISTDITERKKAEEALKENEERFRTLADSITQLAWIANGDGWIYWYNNRWYEYTGTTLEEMQGWGWEKVHHPDHIERVVNFVKEAWQKDEPWELIFPLRRYDGVYRWFLTRGVPVKNKEGKVVQWIGTNTDIEEQKQAEAILEERVQERTQELERRNAELEQFTYVSHHDLQEPLRKILMFTDMVKTENAGKLTATSQLRLEKVMDAARRMSAALRDVLNFASLSKEEQIVELNLNGVLAAVLTDMELVISEKEARITSDALPVIKAVSQHMQQLFYNLINNALKFSKPAQPPAIHIACRTLNNEEVFKHSDLDHNKKYYEIAIQDNGIGFNPESADKIFVMFQRLHSKADYAGTGIGLALCKKVVQSHGGKIWAESNEGKGATFKVLLPAESF